MHEGGADVADGDEQEERPRGFVWRVKLSANLDRANATNLVSWFDSKAPARPAATPQVQPTSGEAPQPNVDEQIEAARMQDGDESIHRWGDSSP